MNTRLSQLSDARAQLALMLGAFVVATVIAKAFGAGWGTASAFGQMAFAATLVAVLLRAG